jgi:hypothetical protein
MTNDHAVRLAALALLAPVLAGCGGGSATTAAHTGTGAATQSTPVTQTTTTTTTAPQTTTATTTTGASGSGACTAADLTAAFLGQNGATGNVVLEFSVRNRGTGRCHTYGYPGVQFLARDGHKLPTTPTRTTQDLLGTTTATAITLAPGAQASFRMVASSTAPGGGSCPTAYALQIIAPDDTVPIKVSIPNGAYTCGKTTVSPLQPGTGAAPGV